MTTVLEASQVGQLDGLVAAHPFKPYRQYRILSRRLQTAVLEAEIRKAVEAGGKGVLAEDGANQAAVVFRPLPWDSEFFGVPMGRIDYIFRSEDATASTLGDAVDACHDACRQGNIQHLTVRVDVADTVAIGVLESRGYRLMDALVTYIYHPRREAPADQRDMGVPREYRPDHAEAIVEIAQDIYRGFRGRFHLDEHLPDDRCDDFYVEWARQVCGGRMGDKVFVAENGEGRVIGFLGSTKREPVSTVGGVEIYGGGLGACRRETPGAYAGLIRAGIAWAHARGAVVECQTQNFNFSTIRVYEAVGCQYTRAEYTFHGWLGG